MWMILAPAQLSVSENHAEFYQFYAAIHIIILIILSDGASPVNSVILLLFIILL